MPTTAADVRKATKEKFAINPPGVNRDWENKELFLDHSKRPGVTKFLERLFEHFEWELSPTDELTNILDILKLQQIPDDSKAAEADTVPTSVIADLLSKHKADVIGTWKDKTEDNKFELVLNSAFPAATISWSSNAEKVVGLVSSARTFKAAEKPKNSNTCERKLASGICISDKGRVDDYILLATFAFDGNEISEAELHVMPQSAKHKSKLLTYVEIKIEIATEKKTARIKQNKDGKAIGGLMTKA